SQLVASGDGRASDKFAYDLAGNITALAGSTLAYSGEQTRVTSPAGTPYTIQHDAAGNRTALGGAAPYSYGYDPRNQLTSITGQGTRAQYGYDHKARRIIAEHDGDVRIYVGNAFVHSLPAQGTASVQRIIRDASGVVAVATKPEGGPTRLQYVTHDPLNTTLLTTDATGRVETRFAYTPFGQLTAGISAADFPVLFGGKAFDARTGLYDFGVRFYDPAIGRFVTADSRIGAQLTRTAALNRYAFVLNDPINFTDPSGHGILDEIFSFLLDIIEIIGGAVAGAFGFENVSRALVGAGIAGMSYDISVVESHRRFSWLEWGVAEAIGAIAGLLVGGIGDYLDATAAGGGGPGPGGGGGGIPMDGMGGDGGGLGGDGGDDGGGDDGGGGDNGHGGDGGDGSDGDDRYDPPEPNYDWIDEDEDTSELWPAPEDQEPVDVHQFLDDMPYYDGPESEDATDSEEEDDDDQVGFNWQDILDRLRDGDPDDPSRDPGGGALTIQD
ncbi:MAG: RHS repeat-associated core domain-containing protein, partial [Pseudomonadota bacterium]